MSNDEININQVNVNVGLTSAQVKLQIKNGNKNNEPQTLTKSVGEIFSENIFTLFNLINVVLGGFVFYTGSYINMLFLGVAAINTIIGIFQELRAKRSVDKMAVMSASKIKVRRHGKMELINPNQLVLGDIIELGRGDQVPVDGIVKKTHGIGVDESSITGESTPIEKNDGDPITSGSFLVSGNAFMVATKVGDNSFVNSLTSKAKRTHSKTSVLISLIKKIIRILTLIIIPLGTLLFVSRLLHHVSLNSAILGTVASMIGMIPEGLVLLTSVTLALSAYNLAKKHVLVRDLNSIETLARVNTICLDKTGTITSGNLKFEKFISQTTQYSDDELSKIIGSLIYDIDDNNETATAMKKHFKEHPYSARKVVAFSSARKWSGVKFSDGKSFVFGAPQFITKLTKDQAELVKKYAKKGMRVLAVASASQIDDDKVSNAQIIGLVLITDVIRPDAEETLRYFKDFGVDIKVISGDDPVTVANIAKRVGLDDWEKYIDMNKVDDSYNYHELVKDYAVFGRVKPDQKEKLIKALQDNGRTVAMTGDGVNDLLALKQSDCGIAMSSGSESVKSIADFVLVDSNFNAMINVLNEGRRVINNIDSIASLYLIKTMFSVMLSVIFLFLARNYPFTPIQLSPINDLMVGIPSFFLALEPNYMPLKDKFVPNIYEISVPASICVVGYILLIGAMGDLFGMSTPTISSLNVLITGVICWLGLRYLCRPINRYKVLILTLSLTGFLSVFIFLGRIFSLQSIISLNVGLIGLMIAITTPIAFLLVQKVSELFRMKFKIHKS